MQKKTIFFILVALVLFTLPGCASEQKKTNSSAAKHKVVDYNPGRNMPRLYDYPNEPDGFQDLPWYISLAEAEQIKQTKFELIFDDDSIKGRKVYQIPGQGAEIFGVYFPEISYTFVEDELTSVIIDFIEDPKQEAYHKLLENMIVTFGQPPEIKKATDGEILLWPGTKTCVDIYYSTEIQATYLGWTSPETAYFGVTAEELLKGKDKTKRSK